MSDNSEVTEKKLANLKPFQAGQSGNPKGRPVGSISLETRIKRILEGDEPLPKVIQETIAKSVGEGRKPIDAVVIVAMLQALQGDKSWADWLTNNGWGKPKERVEHTGADGGPIETHNTHTIKLIKPSE